MNEHDLESTTIVEHRLWCVPGPNLVDLDHLTGFGEHDGHVYIFGEQVGVRVGVRVGGRSLRIWVYPSDLTFNSNLKAAIGTVRCNGQWWHIYEELDIDG